MALVLDDVRRIPEVRVFVEKADEHLAAIGLTEHGTRHASLVSQIARNILERLGHSEREAELAAIAGFMHDIGNMAGRDHHGAVGAALATMILLKVEMDPSEVAQVAGAIGNHEEQVGQAVNNVAAALILADKSDVHRSRVRNVDPATFEIHDRVNYAVLRSFLRVDAQARNVTLELEIDMELSPVMDYFEIFLARMVMCRRAAQFLNCRFRLEINGAKLL
ncbi:MAG: HD domain-containing protein [Firmicutes bacterium]|jgi:metal-dependent HD superfamily phosphatase/phosphodiesterase|nr:HD domain-containing protein [Bacillota bacterium]MDH7495033.1 HD domain-containing protein [Bacillota bacterium]